MDRNFKVRTTVGIGMLVVAVLSLHLFDGMFFDVLFAGFIIVAGIELLSFLKKKHGFWDKMLLILELGFLFYSILYVTQLNLLSIWYLILGIPGYDVFAYLFGKILGGKIVKKSKPFPHISKNKTWEGTVCGLIISFSLVLVLMLICGNISTDWVFLLCGPLALMGDLFESFLKRRFKVKDSNELLIKKPFFRKIELLVGGSEGHGGFLDRIDSTAFTTTVLMIISSFL